MHQVFIAVVLDAVVERQVGEQPGHGFAHFCAGQAAVVVLFAQVGVVAQRHLFEPLHGQRGDHAGAQADRTIGNFDRLPERCVDQRGQIDLG